MNISRSSWHYKLVKFVHPTFPSDNVCGYVKQLIAALLMITFILMLTIVMSWAIGCQLATILQMNMTVYSHIYMTLLGYVILTLTITLAVGTMFAVVYALSYLSGRQSNSKGVLAVWLRNKRNKVCSYIEYKD